MSDVVVTVPRDVWQAWLKEGDCAGDPDTGLLYEFLLPTMPNISAGERVYVVAHNRLRGYAPLVRVHRGARRCYLIRGGGAVPVTLAERIVGFRGYRYRWWEREVEQRFLGWRAL